MKENEKTTYQVNIQLYMLRCLLKNYEKDMIK